MPDSQRTYEINEVAQLTGLSTARLRAWERRYEVVRPVRQPNGYRAYSGEQVALLRALARLVDAGHRIGDLVDLPRHEVLAAAEARYSTDSPIGPMLEAAQALDRERLESLVAQQLALRGLSAFVRDIMAPFAQAIGDFWALGKLPVAAEHLASEVVLHALKGGLRVGRADGPIVLAACLAGERHEWGLLGALAIAQDRGWRVQYLGADLPLDELVEAAWALSPAVVALSAADPLNVRRALDELRALPARLPPHTFVVAGGRGVLAHETELRRVGYRIGLDALEPFGVALPRTGTHRR